MREADRIALRIYLRWIDDIRPQVSVIAEQEKIGWPNQNSTEALRAASAALEAACAHLDIAINHVNQPGKSA